jgi:hypothetical protein
MSDYVTRSTAPQWDYVLRLADVFHNDNLSFEAKRTIIAERVRGLPGNSFRRDRLAAQLEEAADADAFDVAWDEFYDYADEQRIWVATR